MSFVDKIKRSFKKKRVRIPVLILFLFFVGTFLWRACNSEVLVASKTYLLARSSNLAPIRIEGKEPNLLAFESDLLTQIAIDEKLKINILTVSTLDLFRPLDEEYYDAILVTIEPDPLMKEKYYISQPLLNVGPILLVPSSSNIHSLEELEGKGIGVGIESTSPLVFRFSQKDLVLVSYPHLISALEDLDKGIIGGVIIDPVLGYTYTEGFYKNRLKVATAPLTDLAIRVVARDTREGKYLIEHFDQGLKKIKDTGQYKELIKKWELIEPLK